MRKLFTSNIILSLLTVICMHATAFAWDIEKSTHLPRPNDLLDIDFFEGVNPGRSGKHCLWNFSDAIPMDAAKLSFSGIPDTLICARFPRHRMYYSLRGDSLIWNGYESRRILLSDSIGTISMIYPMCQGDSCALSFNFDGRYVIDRPASNHGSGFIKADASGSLILPDGDTIHNTLRVCRQYTGFPRISLNSASALKTSCDELPVVYREYDWYAPGFRYPLFSLRQTLTYTPEGTEEYGESFSYACTRRSQLSELSDDPENQKIRDRTEANDYSYGTPEDDTDSSPEPTNPFRDIQVSTDGNMLSLDFDYNGQSGWLEMIVSDSAAIPYLTIPRQPLSSGQNHVSISIDRLPAGEYALFLLDGLTSHSLKFSRR